ncbi:MAG TPA: NBR1-Ig-like domain-containing protein [Anaerolineales bacterium]|nr:NBR1-Ig-like domain-containing protein [Anaerolineales bacterium]
MDTEKFKLALSVSIFITLSVLTAACSGAFPSPSSSSPTDTPAVATPTTGQLPASIPTPVCVTGLSFLYDITIPDGTAVAPGSRLDKQWLVQNSGSCNWDDSYRLRLVSGNAMGAPTEQALFPARAGTQATIRIVFTAPQDAGEYTSEWQAYAPDGTPFGTSFFIKITVSP